MSKVAALQVSCTVWLVVWTLLWSTHNFYANAWQLPDTSTSAESRRLALQHIVASAMPFLAVEPALATPAEFQNLGTQAPRTDDGTAPFISLANGVKIKDLEKGTGDALVTSDSRVSIQCSGRLLNLNGVVFYNTKNNNPDGFGAIPLTINLGKGRVTIQCLKNQNNGGVVCYNIQKTHPYGLGGIPLTIHLGKGEALPGLEAGLVGMRKNGIRRIIVPAELAYSQFPNLEPQPTSTLDQRALDSVVKNPRRDATILFDVRMERFK